MAELHPWSADWSGAPDGVRDLLQAARPLADMSSQTHLHALARATELAAVKSAPMLALVGGKAAAVAAFGGAGCMALAVGLLRPPAPVVVSHFAPEVAAVERGAPSPPAGLAPAESTVAIEHLPLEPAEEFAAERARRLPRAAAEDELGLGAEVRLLERARAALDQSPSLALRLTREFTRRFPTGQLAAANQCVEVEALDRLGRRAEAGQRAGQLLATDPAGLYAERVRRFVERER